MAKKKKAIKKKAPKVEIPAVPAVAPLPELTPEQRNVAMFKEWITTGKTYGQLATQFGLTVDGVDYIAKKNNWKVLRQKAIDRAFSTAVMEVKSMALTMTLALKRDMEMIIADSIKEKRQLKEVERSHFRTLLDRFFKEARLDEGKPTEITTGTQKVELVLPPGVKRFGIIPPDPRVTLIESTVEEKSNTLSLDDVDVDPKDIK